MLQISDIPYSPPPSGWIPSQLEKVEADLKDARRRGTKLTAELSKLSQDAARLQAQAEQATTRAGDLIATAALEQVKSSAVRRHGSGKDK